jgi:hypothetical protein
MQYIACSILNKYSRVHRVVCGACIGDDDDDDDNGGYSIVCGACIGDDDDDDDGER